MFGKNGICYPKAVSREAKLDIFYDSEHCAELESRGMVNPVIEPAHALLRAATRSRRQTNVQSRLAMNAIATAVAPAVSATHSSGSTQAQTISPSNRKNNPNATHRARCGA